MKLILYVPNDDPVLAEGGPLADRVWKIGHVVVMARSGFGEHGYPSCVTPGVYLHSTRSFYEPPDFRTPFDIEQFEKALGEARVAVKEMETFIESMTAKLAQAIHLGVPQEKWNDFFI